MIVSFLKAKKLESEKMITFSDPDDSRIRLESGMNIFLGRFARFTNNRYLCKR